MAAINKVFNTALNYDDEIEAWKAEVIRWKAAEEAERGEKPPKPLKAKKVLRAHEMKNGRHVRYYLPLYFSKHSPMDTVTTDIMHTEKNVSKILHFLLVGSWRGHRSKMVDTLIDAVDRYVYIFANII